jgi:hypothetical protein
LQTEVNAASGKVYPMAEERPQDILRRLEERLIRLERERERIQIAIQVIKGDAGEAERPEESTGGGEGEEVSLSTFGGGYLDGVLSSSSSPRRAEIRPDTFFGLSHHQAARKYLLDLGHADRLENIVKAIMAGGVDVGGANPVETLRATLTRNTGVFVRVGPGTFGLREFYPHLGNKPPRVVTKKKPQRPKKKIVAKKKKRRNRNDQDEGKEGKTNADSEDELGTVLGALRGVMAS